jgi:hypothetical protein
MIKDIDKCRNMLLCEIAKAINFDVLIPNASGIYSIGEIVKKSKWIKNNYSLEVIEDGKISKNKLAIDLNFLSHNKWIAFDRCENKTNRLGSRNGEFNPLKWNVGLSVEGCEKSKILLKKWWEKAWEKQPGTTIQIVINVCWFLAGFFLSFLFSFLKTLATVKTAIGNII